MTGTGVTDWLIKGVDAGEGGGDIIRLAQQAAQKLNTVIAITGEVDVIADTSHVYTLHCHFCQQLVAVMKGVYM